MLFRNAVICLFSKYFGNFQGPRLVLDTRATIVYKGGKAANPVKVIFWGWKLDSQQQSKQADNRVVLLSVATSYKEKKVVKQKWSGRGESDRFLDGGASWDHIWTHSNDNEEQSTYLYGFQVLYMQRKASNSTHVRTERRAQQCVPSVWKNVGNRCWWAGRAFVEAAAGGERRGSIWCMRSRWIIIKMALRKRRRFVVACGHRMHVDLTIWRIWWFKLCRQGEESLVIYLLSRFRFLLFKKLNTGFTFFYFFVVVVFKFKILWVGFSCILLSRQSFSSCLDLLHSLFLSFSPSVLHCPLSMSVFCEA